MIKFKDSWACLEYKLPFRFIIRLLLWMQAGSICRSFLDGMEVKTVTEVGSYGSHAVDRKTLLVYWTDRDRLEILRCDMDGNNRRVLNLSPLERPHKLTVLNNIMYYQEKFYNSMLRKDATVLIRTDVEQETKQLVYNATDVSYLKILPDVMDTDDIEGFNGNPCAENSCFHMCVQSGQKTHACLCPDGYVLRRESGNCTGNLLTFLVLFKFQTLTHSAVATRHNDWSRDAMNMHVITSYLLCPFQVRLFPRTGNEKSIRSIE